MNQLKHDYESSAKALLEWVQSVIDRFASENLGATLEESLAVTDRLRAFLLNEKPQRTADKLDLESKFAEIQQTLLVHDRPAYECPQEFAPDTIDAAFDALWQAEKAHATAARQHRFAFIKKEEAGVSEDKLQEMKDSYAHFDKVSGRERGGATMSERVERMHGGSDTRPRSRRPSLHFAPTDRRSPHLDLSFSAAACACLTRAG